MYLASSPCGLDSSTGRAADRYPEGVSSNPARVNIFRLTLAVSDYQDKFLFMYISEDDSETRKLTTATLAAMYKNSQRFTCNLQQQL